MKVLEILSLTTHIKAGRSKTKDAPMREHILYQVVDGVGWITLNRPEKKNAMTAAMRRQLYEA